MTSPKIGAAFCNADAIEGGAPAENLTVRKCKSCETTWAHDPIVALLFCPSCLEPAGDIEEEPG